MEKEDAANSGAETASEVDDDIPEELLDEEREEREEQLRKCVKVLLNDAFDAQEDLAMKDTEENKAENLAVKRGKENEADMSAKKADDVETAAGTGEYGRDIIIDFALATIQYAENNWRRPDNGFVDEDVMVQSSSEPKSSDEESNGFNSE